MSNVFLNSPVSPMATAPALPVTVYWDIDRCPAPEGLRGFQVVGTLRSYARNLGVLKNIFALGDITLLKSALRTELQQSGVVLQDVTSTNPSSLDMVFMVEFLKFVCDSKPPHHLVLATGDRDLSNALNILVFRGYDVTLIYPPNTSEVLREAATKSFEWFSFLRVETVASFVKPKVLPVGAELHKTVKGKKMEVTDDDLVLFLIKSIKHSQGKVMLSSLGSSIQETRKDLWDFVSERGGISRWVTTHTTLFTIKANSGGNKEVWVSMEYIRLKGHLKAALAALKRDYLKPTESVVKKAMKAIFAGNKEQLTDAIWKNVTSIAVADSEFLVIGTLPNRVIYPSTDKFEGVDPNSPKDIFEPSQWASLRQFLAQVHPLRQKGRHGFALYLQEQGPPDIRTLPLGQIASMVQLAVFHKLLEHKKGFFHTGEFFSNEDAKDNNFVSKETLSSSGNGSGFSSPPNGNENGYSSPQSPFGIGFPQEISFHLMPTVNCLSDRDGEEGYLRTAKSIDGLLDV